jgi:hypothetical protein
MSAKSPILISPNDTMVLSQRFVLYLKVREISEVNRALKKALRLSPHEQKQWAQENGKILDQALNAFIDDTNLILEKLSLDDEILDLSEKLVTGLKRAALNIDKLLGPQEELES